MLVGLLAGARLNVVDLVAADLAALRHAGGGVLDPGNRAERLQFAECSSHVVVSETASPLKLLMAKWQHWWGHLSPAETTR